MMTMMMKRKTGAENADDYVDDATVTTMTLTMMITMVIMIMTMKKKMMMVLTKTEANDYVDDSNDDADELR